MITTRTGLIRACEFICFAVSLVLSQRSIVAQVRTEREVCADIVTTLLPQRVFKIPTNQLLRVEIRSCMPGATENLQFVAWENDAVKPSLVLTTPDETIVQLVMSGGVFVVETSGGSHDTVFVIVYEGAKSFRRGKPKLALQAVTKGRVVIKTSTDKVFVDYPDLRKEQHHLEYATGIE